MVTGGAGYVGSVLCKKLVNNYNVCVFDQFYFGRSTLSDIENNRVVIGKFGEYINANVYMSIITETVVSIPSQTMICGTPALSYQFSAASDKIFLNIASPVNIIIDFTETQGVTQTQVRGIYIKQ